MNMGDMLKKPAVLLTGLALGLLVLYFAGRNSSAGQTGGNGFSLQSQDIATRANVALSAQTTDYNKAALDFMAHQGANAAMVQSANLSANTALTLHALDSVSAQGQFAAQQSMQQTLIHGSVKLNAQKDASTYQLAKLNADTRITLAPQQAAMTLALAKIESDKALSLASTYAQSAATLATINGANRLSVQQAANDQRTTDDFFSSAVKLAPLALSFL